MCVCNCNVVFSVLGWWCDVFGGGFIGDLFCMCLLRREWWNKLRDMVGDDKDIYWWEKDGCEIDWNVFGWRIG